MKIWKSIQSKLKDNQKVYLLTVVQNSGSSPGRKGFRMMVSEDGYIEGSIGGGIMEYKLVEETKKLLKEQKPPILLKKQIHQGKVKDSSGMICSGEQTVVFHPITTNEIPIVEHLIDCLENKRKGFLALSNTNFKFKENEVKDSFSFKISVNKDWLYREQINYKEIVYIIGAGHVGLAVSKLLHSLNFDVIVFDNRENLNTFNQNNFVVKKQIIDYQNISDYVKSGSNVMIMTTKFVSDKLVLSQLIKSGKKFNYIGVLGSQVKINTMFEMMLSEGFCKTDLATIYAPIGLKIKSETPEEIAISIIAELIKINKS